VDTNIKLLLSGEIIKSGNSDDNREIVQFIVGIMSSVQSSTDLRITAIKLLIDFTQKFAVINSNMANDIAKDIFQAIIAILYEFGYTYGPKYRSSSETEDEKARGDLLEIATDLLEKLSDANPNPLLRLVDLARNVSIDANILTEVGLILFNLGFKENAAQACLIVAQDENTTIELRVESIDMLRRFEYFHLEISDKILFFARNTKIDGYLRFGAITFLLAAGYTKDTIHLITTLIQDTHVDLLIRQFLIICLLSPEHDPYEFVLSAHERTEILSELKSTVGAVELLLTFIQNPPDTDTSFEGACIALGRLGDSNSYVSSRLLNLIQNKQLDDNTRAGAILALAHTPN
jgi:hypothetical protein